MGTENIPAGNGKCIDAHWVKAPGTRRGVVVLFMDGFGPRPVLDEIAGRIAAWGHDVLVPNLYYREEGVVPVDIEAAFAGGEYMARFYERINSWNEAMVVEDVDAIASFTENELGEGEVLSCVGYCLGGRYALSFAGVAEKCSFAASIHGASLATESEQSAHRLAAKGNATVHLSVAQYDPTFSLEELTVVRDTLAGAGKHLLIEIHAGAMHGFSFSDLRPFNEAAREQHFAALARFLKTAD